MSQSDYIKYKRVQSVLKKQQNYGNDLNPVLSQQEYTDYKQYVIETSVINTNTLTNANLDAGSKNIIFDMIRPLKFDDNNNICPNFLFCSNTQTRLNRVPMDNIYFQPRPQLKFVKLLT